MKAIMPRKVKITAVDGTIEHQKLDVESEPVKHASVDEAPVEQALDIQKTTVAQVKPKKSLSEKQVAALAALHQRKRERFAAKQAPVVHASVDEAPVKQALDVVVKPKLIRRNATTKPLPSQEHERVLSHDDPFSQLKRYII